MNRMPRVPRADMDDASYHNPSQQAVPDPLALIETPRCLLRYPLRVDASRALSAFTSPAFPSYVPLGQIRTKDQAATWIETSQSRWSQGTGFTWSVERKSDGVLLGQVTLSRLAEAAAWMLDFWTHPDHWGQGYATEAASRAVDFAFQVLRARRVWAGAAKRNKASHRVLVKLGMAHISDNPAGYTIEDEPIPTRVYEITAVMWREMRLGAAPQAG